MTQWIKESWRKHEQLRTEPGVWREAIQWLSANGLILNHRH